MHLDNPTSKRFWLLLLAGVMVQRISGGGAASSAGRTTEGVVW